MRPPWLLAAVALMAQSSAIPSPPARNTTDLTIKTRQTFDHPGASAVTTQLLYLKDARRRHDLIVQHPGRDVPVSIHTTISHCDRHRTILLNHEHRTYGEFPIGDPTEERRRSVTASRRKILPEPSGPDVLVTTEWTHTGEQRQLGRFTVRRTLTSRSTRPSPGAKTLAETQETDGWYLDVQTECGASSHGFGFALLGFSSTGSDGPADRIRFEHRGVPPVGYPIEITERTAGKYTHTRKIELVEFSEAPLDAALFDVPAGYRPALPLPWGGHDFDRPDTLANRVESYWRLVQNWVGGLFR